MILRRWRIVTIRVLMQVRRSHRRRASTLSGWSRPIRRHGLWRGGWNLRLVMRVMWHVRRRRRHRRRRRVLGRGRSPVRWGRTRLLGRLGMMMMGLGRAPRRLLMGRGWRLMSLRWVLTGMRTGILSGIGCGGSGCHGRWAPTRVIGMLMRVRWRRRSWGVPIGLRTNGLTARNGCHAAPLIHGRHFVPASIHIGSTRIGSGFSPFDFDLFVLNHDIVVSHGFATRHFIGEAQEAESTTLFLLLVVHDHHFYDIAVAHEETLNLRLRDIRGQTAQKHLKKESAWWFRWKGGFPFEPTYLGVILSHIGLLWFLHAPRIASLGIDGSTIERMRYTGQNRVDICGIRERHETKTTGTSRFRIFHHDAINDLAEATKIRQECLLGGIPTEKPITHDWSPNLKRPKTSPAYLSPPTKSLPCSSSLCRCFLPWILCGGGPPIIWGLWAMLRGGTRIQVDLERK